MESQLRKHMNRSAESLNHPPNVEELHRKNAYPDICSEKCTFITCPFRREENYGKMCEKKWQQYKTESQFTPNMRTQIDLVVQKAFKPINDRLEKIETASIERTFTFNGKKMHTYTPTLKFLEALRIDRDRNKN